MISLFYDSLCATNEISRRFESHNLVYLREMNMLDADQDLDEVVMDRNGMSMSMSMSNGRGELASPIMSSHYFGMGGRGGGGGDYGKEGDDGDGYDEDEGKDEQKFGGQRLGGMGGGVGGLRWDEDQSEDDENKEVIDRTRKIIFRPLHFDAILVPVSAFSRKATNRPTGVVC